MIFFTALRDLGRETREAASSRSSNARCKNCMLTVKYDHNSVKKANGCHSTGKIQLASIEKQGLDRTYNKDSFYLPVLSQRASSPSPTINIDTAKNSSELFCDLSPCCINLEMIRLNDDRRCLSDNISENHSTKHKNEMINHSVRQLEPEKSTNPSSQGKWPSEFPFDWRMKIRSQESKKKGHSFNKTYESVTI